MKHEYKNRYGDVFTFTPTEDGNILWEGNFEYHRTGCPNVYDDAYNEYLKDGGELSMKEFIKEVHRYDDTTFEPSEIGRGYRELVYSDLDTIDMVDPSGGPYLTRGMEFQGKVIDRFESVESGYKIICQ
jgi:hypothetical protein